MLTGLGFGWSRGCRCQPAHAVPRVRATMHLKRVQLPAQDCAALLPMRLQMLERAGLRQVRPETYLADLMVSRRADAARKPPGSRQQ